MPHLIRRPRTARFVLTTVGLILLCIGVGGLAAARAQAATSLCPNPPLTQPFTAWGDDNYYTLVRGQDDTGFTGAGWLLSGGASIEQAQLSDGGWGGVLDLPSGSEAISPPVCVNSTYPDARMMVNDVSGSEGVEVFVSDRDTSAWGTPWTALADAGNANGGQGSWSPSDPINLPAPATSDWQLARFVFVPGGVTSEFQIYDFYLDPYSKG
jgi:hypothetical protein